MHNLKTLCILKQRKYLLVVQSFFGGLVSERIKRIENGKVLTVVKMFCCYF